MINRGMLLSVLKSLSDAATEEVPCGLVILRLQRLREIELLFGHEFGERLSEAMAMRLSAALRPQDRLIPIGECDFAVVMPRLHGREHLTLAAIKLVRIFDEAVDVGGQPLLTRVALGAATWPQDADRLETLLQVADAACVTASQRRERFMLHEEGKSVQPIDYGQLHTAIHDNGLLVNFQPLFDVHSREIVGFESLSRWTREDGQSVSPAAFVHLAEQSGLIDELTRWNTNASLRRCADWRPFAPDVTCSINASPVALAGDGFAEMVASALRLWGVPGNSVILEITETAFVEDAERIINVLNELREIGVGIAIDDFGTGFSSFSYLKNFPITELKIDREFVTGLASNARMQYLVAAMIDTAHRIGAHCVAEGVEDEDTLYKLRAMGCDRVQGYLLGRPVPADQAIALLRKTRGLD